MPVFEFGAKSGPVRSVPEFKCQVHGKLGSFKERTLS